MAEFTYTAYIVAVHDLAMQGTKASMAMLLTYFFHNERIFSMQSSMLLFLHYNDVTTNTMSSQITSLTIVYSTVYSGADQRKHQSTASLDFVRGIHRWPVNSPRKGPVTQKMLPFDDVIMFLSISFIPCQAENIPLRRQRDQWNMMMTSLNGNIFGVTGPLCGEFTDHRSIPLTKASDAELWCFLWSAPE